MASNIYRNKILLKDAENKQNEIILLISLFQRKEEAEEESEEESKDDHKKFIKYIENESKGINYDLFKYYFNFIVPSALAKQLYEKKTLQKTMS